MGSSLQGSFHPYIGPANTHQLGCRYGVRNQLPWPPALCAVMSSAASAPSSNSAMTNLKRNYDDVGWDYGVLVDLTNLNVIKCKLCGLVVKAGIYRLKQHIAHIHGEVKPCRESTNQDQQKCTKVIDDSKKAKKARVEKQQQVRDAMDIDGAPVDEEESTNGASQGLDEVGNSVARKVGPLDRFTLPLDPASLSAKVVHEEWAKNGCSLMTDAWTDQKRRSIMNLCLHSIEKVGAKNIVQVVTDNASNNMAAKDLLFVKRPNIFWSLCATHTLNLMLEGIGKMKKFKGIIDQAKAVTIFIYAHHRTLSLMRKYTKKRDIVRPGATRFASSFLTLQSLYEKKDQLRIMSQSLHMVDDDIKPLVAFLYGDILKAKEEIMAAIGNIDKAVNLNLYLGIMEIIDEKMKGRLDTPLHLAVYFLNPYFSYNDPSIFTNEHVMDGLISVVETFYHGDYDKQIQVLNAEMDKFKDKEGHFAKAVAKIPTLQKMAIRILSLTCSSSSCERNWKTKGQEEQQNGPPLATDATHAQGWMVEGGDDEIDVELVAGLTRKLTEEACGTEEVAKLRKSSRLAQMRNVDEDIIEEPKEEPLHDDDEEIEFESDQEDVVPIDGVGEQKGEEDCNARKNTPN
ncbi:uncharacterized protein [Setaria viridis]|uniref:uncharacterized protein n=1 Tax=Setaria viridis TaxID=4556 RepID=UPI003B3A8734